jgi:hypothetical protein
MRLRQMTVGVIPILGLAIVAGGCQRAGQTSLEIKPRDVTPAERARAVSLLPSGFRQGLAGSEDEIAQQLGLQIWAFEFKGGPFGCWIDIEEVGQQTATSPYPRNPVSRVSCEAEEGALLFWFLPRTTPQMPQHLKDQFLKKAPQIPNLFIALATNGKKVLDESQYGNPRKPIVPLWFAWKDADVREQPHAVMLKPGESATILGIEATEKGAVGKPRGVRLSLAAVK